MVWKRLIPIAIAAVVGFITLFGWFIDQPGIETFVNDDATQWFDILASFAIFLGALNLLKLQFNKIIKKQKGWPYALLAILGFLFAFNAGFLMRGAYFVEITGPGDSITQVAEALSEETGLTDEAARNILLLVTPDKPYRLEKAYFTEGGAEEFLSKLTGAGAVARVDPVEWGAHVSTKGSLFRWMFDFIFTPLSATMFALLAFFVASASYRAFKIRNFEATLLLVSGIIIMLGRVPIGSNISAWFVMYILVLVAGIFVNSKWRNRQWTFGTVLGGIVIVTIAGFVTGWPMDQPAIFYLPILQDWIYNNPNVAGARAIMIGIGLGIFATSIRYILGIEKSYIGE
ncbi:MAG: hypothetical protein ACE5D8_06655 [Fidelibacterota bacterium]